MLQQKFSEIIFNANSNILLLQLQILKDFIGNDTNFPVDFNTTCYSKEEIQTFIELNLVHVIEKGERFLLQLLYKIDLPENEFLLHIQKENISKTLSEAILIKEMSKIYFRNLYK